MVYNDGDVIMKLMITDDAVDDQYVKNDNDAPYLFIWVFDYTFVLMEFKYRSP